MLHFQCYFERYATRQIICLIAFCVFLAGAQDGTNSDGSTKCADGELHFSSSCNIDNLLSGTSDDPEATTMMSCAN